jgi:hypothetical protein
MKLGSTLEWRNVTVRSMHLQVKALQEEIRLLERFIGLLESVGKERQQRKKKKLHWTQTAEGKKKMAEVQREAWKERRRA